MSDDIVHTERPKTKLKQTTDDEIQIERRDNGETQENSPKIKKKTPLVRRFSSFRSTLRPNLTPIRRSFRKISCMRGVSDEEEETLPFNEAARRKSFDISVGLARKMSMFIFTKKSSCVHPYHPYYPEQTTRKIYVIHEEH
ncbi:hypothetical protein O0L34_g17289 [Tuta absoluta]|nr:hypothetical protein O0L34_g17289 [Tuta absoluta]